MTLGQLQAKIDVSIQRLGTDAPVRVIGYEQAPKDGSQYLASAQGISHDDGRRQFLLVVREDA